jgi:iron complex outermembrane receptor protein
MKTGFESDINEKTRMNFILYDEYSIVNSVNYSGIKTRNLAGVTISLKRKFGEKLGYTALLTQSIKDNGFLIPAFSAGMDYKLLRDREYFLKINFSHNSKIPSLNDMYWNPGGNIHLKNEYSYTGELTYEMSNRLTPSMNINSQLSMYLISIDNMIKWTPGTSGYWSPSNVEMASSSGLEGNISFSYISNSLRISINTKYAWNRAHITKSSDGESITGKQLVYVPEHQFNASIRTTYGNYYFMWMSCLTGRRYTSTDNSQYIPGYFLNNASAGVKIGSGKSIVDFNLKFENLFNVNYQAIAWYPMPGRSAVISIIYKFGI